MFFSINSFNSGMYFSTKDSDPDNENMPSLKFITTCVVIISVIVFSFILHVNNNNMSRQLCQVYVKYCKYSIVQH